MEFKMSYIGIIALIGAVLAIASVFLGWFVLDLGIFGKSDISGWEIFDDSGSYDLSYIPLVILIIGIVAALLAVLEFAGMGSMITRIVLLVLGVLVIALAYYLYSDINESGIFDMGVGMYLEFAAGIALIIGPLLGIVGVIDE